MPVNSWTMALKFEVSVVRTVVGARRDALLLFFGFRVEDDAAAGLLCVGGTGELLLLGILGGATKFRTSLFG